MTLWVINCRAISQNARLLFPTKLPHQRFAVEPVTGQERSRPTRTARQTSSSFELDCPRQRQSRQRRLTIRQCSEPPVFRRRPTNEPVVGKRNGGCRKTNNRRHCGTTGKCAERACRFRQETPAGREWSPVPQDRGNEGQCCELRLGNCQRPDPLAADGRTPKMLPPYPRQRGLGRGEPKFDFRHTLDGATVSGQTQKSEPSPWRIIARCVQAELPVGSPAYGGPAVHS